MIEGVVNILLLKIFSAYFSEKWGQSSKSFRYMEMHADFNLLLLKLYIWNYLRPQSTLKKLKN